MKKMLTVLAVIFTGKILLSCLKGVLTAVLAVAVIIAGQMALTGVLGFHTAEAIGKTAMTALFLYAILRMFRTGREAKV